MTLRCRSCSSPLHAFELHAAGGGAVYLAIENELPEDEAPTYRYLDAHVCFDCGTADLALVDQARFLELEGQSLSPSDRGCPACRRACHGPIAIACDAVPDQVLAFLDNKYGAPLWSRLCVPCGKVWLRLDPEDAEARRELTRRFPDGGACTRCGEGQRRVTTMDAPYSGEVRLQDEARALDLLLAICDSCGEAATELDRS